MTKSETGRSFDERLQLKGKNTKGKLTSFLLYASCMWKCSVNYKTLCCYHAVLQKWDSKRTGLLQERSTGLLTTRYGTYDKSLAMLRKWEIDPEIGWLQFQSYTCCLLVTLPKAHPKICHLSLHTWKWDYVPLSQALHRSGWGVQVVRQAAWQNKENLDLGLGFEYIASSVTWYEALL